MANSFASCMHLDRQVTNTTTGVSASYDGGTDTTTWTLPYSVDTDQVTQGHLTIARTDTFVWFEDISQAVNAGVVVSRPAVNQIAVAGLGVSLVSVTVIIGVLFTASFQLSTLYQRNEKGGVEQRGRLQQKYMNVSYEPMTNLSCIVTPQGRAGITYVFSDPTAQSDENENYPWRIPLLCRNENSTIEFTDSTPGSFRVIMIDWEAMLALRSKPV